MPNRLYFLTKQIFIFQEALSSPRKHIIFQETLIPQQIGISEEGKSQWLLS